MVLVTTEHQPALLGPGVHARLVDANDRMVSLNAGNWLRDEQLMPSRYDRHRDAHLVREERRPGTGGVDDHRALDRALGGLDPLDPPALMEEAGDRRARGEGDAHLSGCRR